MVAFHGPAGETPTEIQAEKSHVKAVGWVLKPQRVVGWSQRAWVQILALPYQLRDLSSAAWPSGLRFPIYWIEMAMMTTTQG